MFTNILFLVLALLMPLLLPVFSDYGMFDSPEMSFIAGVSFWLLLLCVIWIQSKLFSRFSWHKLILFFNIEILISLSISLFFIGMLKPLFAISSTLAILFTLMCYLIAIGWAYYLRGGWSAAKQNSLFLLPFAMPFLLLWGASEIFPDNVYTVPLFLVFLVAIVAFLPWFIQKTWQCEPLQAGETKTRLEALCSRLKFRNAGLKVWKLMRDSHTAAIVGVLPKQRYVMFTQRLLDNFPVESTEAVLAHEIGHSKLRHLLYYPFIVMGIIFISLTAMDLLSDPLAAYFDWHEAYYFTMFALFALILGLGMRFIFGFFSRLFEREADLYVLEAGIEATHMNYALNEIGNLTGNSHDKPNWHHYSLRQRMNTLSSASTNPALIANHHRRVKLCLKIYFLVFFIAVLIQIYFDQGI